MKFAAYIALVATTEARHHHHSHNSQLVSNMSELEAMSTTNLVNTLQITLNSALAAEAKDDAASAVAKTAAIKNIQKALTARILKRLDDGQPLVEVARKMKAIEGMQPQINDMERRLGIMQSVEPVLENAIKTLQKVVDVRGMGKALIQLNSEEMKFELPKTKDEIAAMSREEEEAYNMKKMDDLPKGWNDPAKISPEEAKNKEEMEEAAASGAKAIADGDKKSNEADIAAIKESKKEETKSDSKTSKDNTGPGSGDGKKEEKKDDAVLDELKKEKKPEEKKAALSQLRRLDVTAYGFE